MRALVKRGEPPSLAAWRKPRLDNHRLPVADQQEGFECDYVSLRADKVVLHDLEDRLHAEQGGLCAYTGHIITLPPIDPSGRARKVGFHIEHIKAQKQLKGCPCADTEYENLGACWPAPNPPSKVKYGAVKKKAWPEPSEAHLFLSPLDPTAPARLRFGRDGTIAPTSATDRAAAETIEKLGLDAAELVALRRAAIDTRLGLAGSPPDLATLSDLLQALREQAAALDQGETVQLAEFCFALEAALVQEIALVKQLQGQP